MGMEISIEDSKKNPEKKALTKYKTIENIDVLPPLDDHIKVSNTQFIQSSNYTLDNQYYGGLLGTNPTYISSNNIEDTTNIYPQKVINETQILPFSNIDTKTNNFEIYVENNILENFNSNQKSSIYSQNNNLEDYNQETPYDKEQQIAFPGIKGNEILPHQTSDENYLVNQQITYDQLQHETHPIDDFIENQAKLESHTNPFKENIEQQEIVLKENRIEDQYNEIYSNNNINVDYNLYSNQEEEQIKSIYDTTPIEENDNVYITNYFNNEKTNNINNIVSPNYEYESANYNEEIINYQSPKVIVIEDDEDGHICPDFISKFLKKFSGN